MADITDHLKYNGFDDRQVVWKWPTEELRIGTRLIVGQGQSTVFVKNGKVFDVFKPGAYFLKTSNLPLLRRVVKFPFLNKKTPFTAEVWFVNTSHIRSLKWGTPDAVTVNDPILDYPVDLTANGSWGFQVTDPKKLLEKLVGTISQYSAAKIDDFFRNEVIQHFREGLGSLFSDGNVDAFNVNSQLVRISRHVKDNSNKVFRDYGLEVTNFSIGGIKVSEDNLREIREIKKKKMEVSQLSKVESSDTFREVKKWETLRVFGENPNSGGTIRDGMGLGAGLGLGKELARDVSAGFRDQEKGPPKRTRVEKIQEYSKLLEEGKIDQEQYKLLVDTLIRG